MAKLTKLREQLQFNKEMAGVINALKGVAASEFTRLQRERKKLDEFDLYLKKFFQVTDLDNSSHIFLEKSSLPSHIVLITSDGGFLGKLNISIINTAFEQYKKNDRLTVLGKQGVRYIEEKTEEFYHFPGISDDISFDEVEKIKNYIIKQVLEKKVSRTIIVYPHFVSFAIQEVQYFQLFPCRHLFSEKLKPENNNSDTEEEKVIIEPSFKRVIEELITIWIGYVLYNIFWESKLSEWAARVIHLEGSADEVKRQGRAARLTYFRALHENSDKNIREIFSSTMALKRTRWN